MFPNPAARYLFPAGYAIVLVLAGAARADLAFVSYPRPTFDRWMYPFNASPGTRGLAPSFGAVGEPDFDNRDSQVLLGFVTADDIPAALGPANYRIVSARVTIMVQNDLDILYDPTQDRYTTYLEGGDDTDPGRDVIITGSGFRNGWDAFSFGERGPFPFGSQQPRTRNVYALSYFDSGAPIDISNNVIDAFDPRPFAVGKIPALDPGDPVPALSVYEFDLDVRHPAVQCYLRQGLDEGILSFCISSLHFAMQPPGAAPAFIATALHHPLLIGRAGPPEGGLTYPAFYMKEDPDVFFGVAEAASLTLAVQYEPDPLAGDLNGDGAVNQGDLELLLGDLGLCICCPQLACGCTADLNGDNVVDGSDLSILFEHWTD